MISVQFSGADDMAGEVDGPFFLSSTGSWSEFGEAVKSPKAAELYSSGKVTDTAELRRELQSHTAFSPCLGATVAALLALIGEGDQTETMEIVDDA